MSQQNILRSGTVRPPVPVDPAEEARLEAEAVRWCEKKGRALDRKKSGYQPKRRGGSCENSRR